MILHHIAIWTDRLEEMKDFYVKYFGGEAGKKYANTGTGFESYFISFGNGARIELMSKPGIPGSLNDTVTRQHLGLIHLAFETAGKDSVDLKAAELLKSGYKILRGPRKTGDGYYEFETLDPDNNRIEVTCSFI